MVTQVVRLSQPAIPLALVSLGASAPAVAQPYPSSMIRFVTGGPVSARSLSG